MIYTRNTRIVCTIGPAVQSDNLIKELINKGMNIARFNFSHGNYETHEQSIKRIRKVSKQENTLVALLIDTKGPEIRTGIIKDNAEILFEKDSFVDVIAENDAIKLYGEEGKYTTKERITVTYNKLADDVIPGVKILIADGLVGLQITEIKERIIKCRVVDADKIGSRKNVNVIGVKTKLPALTEQDKKDLLFAHQQKMDYVAASFIRKASDIITIQKYLAEIGSDMPVIAKIEDEEGLENIEEIIRVAAGVMVARGDLGVQIPPERVPLAQKKIINLCNAAGKPVITATQMLDSMIRNPRATRAEAADVANAILDGTDCVMLSGETASGLYPIEAVSVMDRIAREVEASDEYLRQMEEKRRLTIPQENDLSHAITNAASWTADKIEAACIIVPTLSGNTAKLVSKHRPRRVIIAASPNEFVRRRLLLYWGIIPVEIEHQENSEKMIQNAISESISKGFASLLDKVVILAGIPIHSPLSTNNIMVQVIGKVLGRGTNGFGKKCSGKVIKVSGVDETIQALRYQKGRILLTHTLDTSFIPIIPNVDGIILQGVAEMAQDFIKEINPDIVMISEVPDAMEIFESSNIVTLDGKEKLIYEGTL